MAEYHINANARSLDVTIGKRRQAEVHVILTGFVTFVCEIFFYITGFKNSNWTFTICGKVFSETTTLKL